MKKLNLFGLVAFVSLCTGFNTGRYCSKPQGALTFHLDSNPDKVEDLIIFDRLGTRTGLMGATYKGHFITFEEYQKADICKKYPADKKSFNFRIDHVGLNFFQYPGLFCRAAHNKHIGSRIPKRTKITLEGYERIPQHMIRKRNLRAHQQIFPINRKLKYN